MKCFRVVILTGFPHQQIKVAVDFLWQGFRAGSTPEIRGCPSLEHRGTQRPHHQLYLRTKSYEWYGSIPYLGKAILFFHTPLRTERGCQDE